MAHFIECKTPNIKISKSYEIVNSTINIEQVFGIEKTEECEQNQYNGEIIDLFVITFYGSHPQHIFFWRFLDIKERDKEYDRIMTLANSKKLNLKPDDVLIFKVSRLLSPLEAQNLQQECSDHCQNVGIKNHVMVICEDIELLTVSGEDDI